MNRYPVANVAGVFRKLLAEDWLVQSYGGSMRYMKKGVLLESTAFEPIYSYGHNYNKFDLDFSLFMWTTERDQDKVSAYFDEVVKGLTKDKIKQITDQNERFLYVDKEYNGTT